VQSSGDSSAVPPGAASSSNIALSALEPFASFQPPYQFIAAKSSSPALFGSPTYQFVYATGSPVTHTQQPSSASWSQSVKPIHRVDAVPNCDLTQFSSAAEQKVTRWASVPAAALYESMAS